MLDPRQRLATLIGRAEQFIKAPIADDKIQDYARLRREYRLNIYGAVVGYLDSGGSVTRYKGLAKRAVVNHFDVAFYTGYAEEGAEETEREDERWLTQRVNAELEFVDDLFDSLRELRQGEGLDVEAEAQTRADGYAASLDGVYTEGRLRGAKNKTLVFDGDDGAESCRVCQSLKGKRHTIRWILEHDAIPRPGNEFFECRGYLCEHYWKDPRTGERVTL